MKKISIVAVALVMALALVPVAFADSFTYSYTGTQGETATGTLTGSWVGPGVYDITSGTITLSSAINPAFNATGQFVSETGDFDFHDGGGTILTFSKANNLLYPTLGQVLDSNGVLLFSMAGFNVHTGQGTGFGLAIGSNSPGYWAFGDSWAINDSGRLSVSAVPIPPSALMLVPGLVGLIGLRKRFKA